MRASEDLEVVPMRHEPVAVWRVNGDPRHHLSLLVAPGVLLCGRSGALEPVPAREFDAAMQCHECAHARVRPGQPLPEDDPHGLAV